MKYASFACAILSAFLFASTASRVHLELVLDLDAGHLHRPKGVHDDSKIDQEYHSKPQSTGPEDYLVDLGYEKHRGFQTHSGKYLNFSNIPYAEPPTGDFRWAWATPPGERDEFNNGSRRAICPQFRAGWMPAAEDFVTDVLLENVLDNKWDVPISPGDYERFKRKPEVHQDSSEDCLLLDVMVPKKVWERRDGGGPLKAAVLVWIHGGGFVTGSKDQYGSPEHLLDAATQTHDADSIIFVSINYRLGAFGWLGGQAAWEDDILPNVGLKDQELAIQWVNDNIYLFGGDGSRITLMGEGSGAASIMHHITSRSSSKPRFKSAIIQSPAFVPSPNKTTASETYLQFRSLTGAENFDELVKVDTEILMQANAEITFNSSYGMFNFGPTVDDLLVRKLPAIELGNGDHIGNIGLMIGHTKYSGLLFTPPWVRTDAHLRKHIRTMYPGTPEAFLDEVQKRYPITDSATAREKVFQATKFLDDIAIHCNTYYLTKAMLKFPFPVYRYVYNVAPAYIGNDLPYTFFPYPTKPKRNEGLANFWQGSIANFTLYFDPNDEESAFWPQYTEKERKVLDIGRQRNVASPSFELSVGEDLVDAERCEFWRGAPYFKEEDGEDRVGGGFGGVGGVGQERMEM
ncbi:alpha/beta-hydrolase [Ophiobolus disseminans]|uniref:Alpha/beta-hydrolase n=1 Tax=Ophiobolus disseminans TaxID=1469910 RepID=A0A6A6ZZD2_9PLEO|nr:alpha/beta-hydrolase [Ophiobolus disseminans]